ncbi:SHOCT domain-containing protein [Planococcus sp. X10-3]|uniref:SHOCT domain-containing protein n=1 Tax=Planococcus sp. X10-3 TaxID=3061240 RepID=UPI003BB08254
MWNYGMHDGSWATMFFLTLFLLLFIALAVVLIVYFMRKTQNTEGGSRSSSSATDLLRDRYARGEISTEEYRERLHELEGYDTKK